MDYFILPYICLCKNCIYSHKPFFLPIPYSPIFSKWLYSTGKKKILINTAVESMAVTIIWYSAQPYHHYIRKTQFYFMTFGTTFFIYFKFGATWRHLDTFIFFVTYFFQVCPSKHKWAKMKRSNEQKGKKVRNRKKKKRKKYLQLLGNFFYLFGHACVVAVLCSK